MAPTIPLTCTLLYDNPYSVFLLPLSLSFYFFYLLIVYFDSHTFLLLSIFPIYLFHIPVRECSKLKPLYIKGSSVISKGSVSFLSQFQQPSNLLSISDPQPCLLHTYRCHVHRNHRKRIPCTNNLKNGRRGEGRLISKKEMKGGGEKKMRGLKTVKERG